MDKVDPKKSSWKMFYLPFLLIFPIFALIYGYSQLTSEEEIRLVKNLLVTDENGKITTLEKVLRKSAGPGGYVKWESFYAEPVASNLMIVRATVYDKEGTLITSLNYQVDLNTGKIRRR